MSEVINWIATGGALTLQAAVAATPLALLVYLIDSTIGRRTTARLRCLLWTLVAIRLLIPVAPASVLSLQNVWRLAASPSAPYHAHSVEAAPPLAMIANTPVSLAEISTLNSPDGVAHPEVAAPADASWEIALFGAVPLLWFVGMSALFLRAAIASARFAWRLRTIRAVDDRVVIDILHQVCRQLGVQRRPQVKYVANLSAPALFGVFRPTLCLPDETRPQVTAGQLRLIMLHEVMHLRRRDGYLSWMLIAVQAAHWFNPIAWLATSRVALYREQACDDAVRQFTAPTERRDYADLLLRFATGRPTINLGLVGTGFARPVYQLAERIKAFGRTEERRRKIPRLLFAAIVILLAAAGFTDATCNAEADNAKPTSVSEWMASGAPAPRAANALTITSAGDRQDDAVAERTHDISKALKKLNETNPDADARQWLLSYLKLPSLNPKSIRKVDGDPNQLQLVMTPRQHEFFGDLLESIGRAGPWQVSVQVRVLRGRHIEAIGDIDWQDAVKFALPTAAKTPEWPDRSTSEVDSQQEGMSVSVESVSWEYAPYLAFVADARKMSRVLDRFQGDRRANLLSCPKVTVFSGQQASIRDESHRPFVVGVSYVKGELATAAQPEIAVLSEGSSLDVQPWVVDANSLDLQCRLTVSGIESVSETKLPGQNVTVQNPRALRRTISARCRVAPGETLLIAPIAAATKSDNDDSEVLYFAITAEWFPDPWESAEQ